jgi:hypothetical protein
MVSSRAGTRSSAPGSRTFDSLDHDQRALNRIAAQGQVGQNLDRALGWLRGPVGGHQRRQRRQVEPRHPGLGHGAHESGCRRTRPPRDHETLGSLEIVGKAHDR